MASMSIGTVAPSRGARIDTVTSAALGPLRDAGPSEVALNSLEGAGG